MRKLLLVLAVVFAASLYTAAGVNAAAGTTKKKVGHAIVAKHKAMKSNCRVVCKPKMHKTHKMKRVSRPARYARGPVVTCPAPVVNVPQQAAPVVNVPQGPAPVVNVPPMPPTVGITVDDCSIYIVRENQLMILDKNTLECKKTMPLQ